MEKLLAYKMSISEAEGILQNALDNASLKLVGDMDFPSFFYAKSDSQCLNGTKVDERFAQFLGVKSVEHYATEDGGLIALVTEE